MSFIAFFTIFVLGPIPPFHFILHKFLKIWRKNPKSIYLMGFFLWIIFFVFAYFISKNQTILFIPPAWLVLSSKIIGFAALFLFIWSVITLGPKKFFLWAVIAPEKVEQKHINSGPYKYFSHPGYYAYTITSIVAFLGTGLLTLLLFGTYCIFAIAIVIILEEKEMKERLPKLDKD